jgi:hypothetical protein
MIKVTSIISNIWYIRDNDEPINKHQKGRPQQLIAFLFNERSMANILKVA